ncbi:MAG: hypothetical protein V1484_00605 [bacterium]
MCKYNATVEEDVPESELKKIQEILKEIGSDWNVEANYFKKGVTPEPQWVLMLNFFLAGFFGAAGIDAYQKLKKVLKKLFDMRRRNKGSAGTILIQDTETKIIYKMPMELNDEEFSKSMKELSKTDLKNFDHGWVYYKKEKKFGKLLMQLGI